MKHKHILKALTLLSITAILAGCGEKTTTTGTLNPSTNVAVNKVVAKDSDKTLNTNGDPGSTEESDRKNYPHLFTEGCTMDLVVLRAMTADAKAQSNEQSKKLHEQQAQSNATQEMYDEQHKQQEAKDAPKTDSDGDPIGKAYLQQMLVDEQNLVDLIDIREKDAETFPTVCASVYFHKTYGKDTRLNVKNISVISDTVIQYMVIMPDKTVRNIDVEMPSKGKFKLKSDEENGYYKMFPLK